jgi:hypothetical protein
MHFEVKRMINVGPEKVWSILTNRQLLVEGGFGILKLEGDIKLNSKIKLWTEVNPGRVFPLQVMTFNPTSLMIWEGGMPFGLFKGVRRFVLEGIGTGCSFHMREDYSGLLAGMIGRSIPDLLPSSDKFSDALKFHAEAEGVK